MIKEEKYGHFLFNLCKIDYFLKFCLEQNFHRFRQKIIIVPFQFSLQNIFPTLCEQNSETIHYLAILSCVQFLCGTFFTGFTLHF